MKERPILFSAPMVRAILGGQKTQTRRIIKPQPDTTLEDYPYWHIGGFRLRKDAKNPLRSPYGVPGDRLWVRETWSPDHRDVYPNFPIVYRADGYPSDDDISGGMLETGDAMICRRTYFRWRPSIHMPRHASRINLEVTDVRVERLQNISEADALADGGWTYSACPIHKSPQRSFADLWESINGKGSWNVNPWIWALSFRKIDPVT